MGCFGDGGAVATNRDDIVDRIRALRNHGSLKRSYHSMGYNSRLDELQAADRFRFVNRLEAWIEVEDGRIVDAGQRGGGGAADAAGRTRDEGGPSAELHDRLPLRVEGVLNCSHYRVSHRAEQE